MSTETKPLADQTREELNALAATLGVTDPDKLGNKPEVIAAIELAQAGKMPPPPPATKAERSQVEELGHPFAEAYRYVGPGIWPGVPDRHLTSADVAQIPADVLRDIHFGALYEPSTDAELAELQERV